MQKTFKVIRGEFFLRRGDTDPDPRIHKPQDVLKMFLHTQATRSSLCFITETGWIRFEYGESGLYIKKMVPDPEKPDHRKADYALMEKASWDPKTESANGKDLVWTALKVLALIPDSKAVFTDEHGEEMLLEKIGGSFILTIPGQYLISN
ncbi:MAG: hypothetical protein AAB527_01700 [Patescibacteria group bacterium]